MTSGWTQDGPLEPPREPRRRADPEADADARPPRSRASAPRRGTASRMWRGSAPTAMRMPISRVRSVTLTSMMFMMPMPPTRSDTAATLASSSVIVSVPCCWALGDLAQVADREVVVVAGRDVVAVAQERRDVLLRARRSSSDDVAADDDLPLQVLAAGRPGSCARTS